MARLLGSGLKKLGGLGSSGSVYLLRDEFTTDASAPLASPRSCEPGPGSLTLVQNDGQLSIVSGKFTYPAQATPVDGDQGFFAGALSRLTGRALIYEFTYSASSFPMWGWSRAANAAAANLDAGVFQVGADFRITVSGAGNPGTIGVTLSTSTSYQVAIVLRSAGAYYFIKGGTFTNWTLIWITDIGSTATIYPAFCNSAGAGSMDYIYARDVGGVFAADDGACAINIPNPTASTTYAASADHTVELTLTAAAAILTIGGFRFRVQDASNYWIAYFDALGAFKVDKVTAGVPATQINVAGVITGSGTRRIRATYRGSTLVFHTLNGATWTTRGSVLTDAGFSSAIDVQPDFGIDWTATNLKSYTSISATYTSQLGGT